MAFPKLLQKLFQNNGGGSKLREDIIPVDTALSATSTNAVQNKIVKTALDSKFGTDGGTMTGDLKMSGDREISSTTTGGGRLFIGTTAASLNGNNQGFENGSSLLLRSSTYANEQKGNFYLIAATSSANKSQLVGTPSGSLTWNGADVATVPNNAGAHNSLFRGINLLTKYTEAQISAKIQAGDFSDLFIGDYIPKTINISGVGDVTANWTIAHFDYFMRMGWGEDNTNQSVDEHHVVLVPDKVLFNAQMNSSNTTAGGYVGSAMYTTQLPKVQTALQTAFGSDHVLKYYSILSNSVAASAASAAGAGWTGSSNNWAWKARYCDLMSEPMVYGTTVFSSSGYDVGVLKTQLALFRLSSTAINIRVDWWLSAVAYAPDFALVVGGGFARADAASISLGVRPFFVYH